MFPFIRNKPTYTLNIPKLSGGVNYRDGISLIKDNQLTDCKNVWYKDGMLKTRPRVRSNDEVENVITISTSEAFNYGNAQKRILSFEPENCAIINGNKYILQVVGIDFDSEEQGTNSLKVRLNYINSSNVKDKIFVGEFSLGHYFGEAESMLVFQHNGDIYCFVDENPECSVVRIKRKSEGEYYEPEKISEEDLYAPIIATNCMPSSNNSQPTFSGGTVINGYNLLTPYYKVEYSTVTENEESNQMIFHLPEVLFAVDWHPETIGRKVVATITNINGTTTTHEVVLENSIKNEEKEINSTDNMKMKVGINRVWFVDANDEIVTVHNSDFVKNNMTIKAPLPMVYNKAEGETFIQSPIKKVVSMTRATWYGGAYYGIYGGSRLFLGGNINENEQALVVWSDLNNPLYFSENNYAYVGDKSQAVTAFGRQGESLVIFKEREIFSTQYVQPDAPTAEEIINQSVIDLSTQSAYFPIIQVHGYIGCDCPDTVQLCRNRLVWANSDGKVYTLVSQNQYNERAIFCISEMIERKLKKETNLTKALTADYDGYYIIIVDNRMYIMDYNSYGYNYVSSYSKSEDANINIPWYSWELPVTPSAVAATSQSLLMPVIVISGTEERKTAAVNMFYIDGTVGADEVNLPIYDGEWKLQSEIKTVQSAIQTKLFDFGQPASLKSVPIVNISFGYNNGLPIKVRFISERQFVDEHTVTLNGTESQEFSPEYMHPCRLFPYTKGTVRFGAVLECDGEMSIDSITLQYKALGGAK